MKRVGFSLCLAAMAMVTMSAFAASASASTYQWVKNGQPLTSPQTVVLTGWAYATELSTSSYECEVKAEATLYPGNEGEITRFDFLPASCSGSGGFEGCVLESGEAADSWPIQATEKGLVVKGFKIVAHYGENGCMYDGYSLTTEATGDWVAKVNNQSAISTLSLGGEVSVYPLGGEVTTEYGTGNLAVSPAGVYGIAKASEPGLNWVHHTALKSATETSFAGNLDFHSTFADIRCNVNAKASLGPAKSGSLTSLEVDKGSCVGSNMIRGCTVAKASALGMPRTLSASAKSIKVSGLEIVFEFAPLCEVEEFDVRTSEVTLTPDNLERIGKATVSGSAIMEILGLEQPVTISGTWHPAAPGLFGVNSGGSWIRTDPLTSSAKTSFTGYLQSNSVLAGVWCSEVSAEATLNPGGSGSLTALAVNKESCVGEGATEGCTVTKASSLSLPWTLSATAKAIELNKLKVHFEFASGCEIEEFDLNFGKLTLAPDNLSSIGKVTIESENGVMEVLGIELPAGATATLNAAEPGAYGVG
jgi:hypothetical protein